MWLKELLYHTYCLKHLKLNFLIEKSVLYNILTFFQTLMKVSQHQQKSLRQHLTVANKFSNVRPAVGTHGESKKTSY